MPGLTAWKAWPVESKSVQYLITEVHLCLQVVEQGTLMSQQKTALQHILCLLFCVTVLGFVSFVFVTHCLGNPNPANFCAGLIFFFFNSKVKLLRGDTPV